MTPPVPVTPPVEPVEPDVPDIPDAREHIKLSMVNQTGSYTGFDGEKHTLLNGKENIRLEDIDDKNVVETETKD